MSSTAADTGAGLAERAAWWHEQEAQMHAAISQRAWSARRNAFVSAFDGDAMDATLLLLAEVGFLDPADRLVDGQRDVLGQAILEAGTDGVAALPLRLLQVQVAARLAEDSAK